MAYQPGHPFGFFSSIYVGEVALCQPLWDPMHGVAKAKEKIDGYPERLRRELVRRFVFEAAAGRPGRKLEPGAIRTPLSLWVGEAPSARLMYGFGIPVSAKLERYDPRLHLRGYVVWTATSFSWFGLELPDDPWICRKSTFCHAFHRSVDCFRKKR